MDTICSRPEVADDRRYVSLNLWVAIFSCFRDKIEISHLCNEQMAVGPLESHYRSQGKRLGGNNRVNVALESPFPKP